MKVRLYARGTGDAERLDRLIGSVHDVRIDRDRLLVGVGDDNLPAAALVWRPSAFIHQFDVPDCLGQASIANALMSSAIRMDINRRHLIRQAVFLVDGSNARMLRYIRDDVKATEQHGIIFTLDLPAPGATTNESNGPAR